MTTRRWRAVGIVLVLLAAMGTMARASESVCAHRWPGDYEMQEHCEGKQKEAAQRLDAWTKEHHAQDAQTPAGGILATCTDRWKDANGSDFEMIDYCVQQQWAAYQRLHPK
jgi:hypothetical protein